MAILIVLMAEELAEYHTTAPVEDGSQHGVRCGANIPAADGQHLPEGTDVREYDVPIGGPQVKWEWRPLSDGEMKSGAFVACQPSAGSS